jgi:hypothetical protein
MRYMRIHTDVSDLEKEVAGEYNTFRTYVYMLKAKRVSVREVQRALGFSSPALAAHHLQKLQNFGLVTKDRYGIYHVVPKNFGILKFFVVTGRWIVPYTIIVAAMFATMTIGFLICLPQHECLIWAFIVSVIGLIISVYQTTQFYKLLPKEDSYKK